jgi:hypothetical protein
MIKSHRRNIKPFITEMDLHALRKGIIRSSDKVTNYVQIHKDKSSGLGVQCRKGSWSIFGLI